VGNSVSLCVNDVTLHLAAFASEESDQILLGQTVVVVRQTPHRLVLLDTFDVEGAPEMAHHCRIEGDLTKFAAGVRVRLKKDIRVRLNEDPDRQFTRTEQNLCGGFVLPIKHFEQTGTIRLWCPPGEGDVKLRTLLKKLFDESSDVRTDAARIDAVVVVKVFERKCSKERPHATQFVFEKRDGVNAVISCL